jgi:hypothetical protein
MPLKNFNKQFLIDSFKLWNSDLLKRFQSDIGNQRTYEMILRVVREAVDAQNVNESNGYFEFGFLFGFDAKRPKGDVDRMWRRLGVIFDLSDLDVYGNVKRCLGTILMASVADDPRTWMYIDDPEKKKKKEDLTTPDPNKYFIRPYAVPTKTNPKAIVPLQEAVKTLSAKFRVKI